jgi:predicted transcriptional regulator
MLETLAKGPSGITHLMYQTTQNYTQVRYHLGCLLLGGFVGMRTDPKEYFVTDEGLRTLEQMKILINIVRKLELANVD